MMFEKDGKMVPDWELDPEERRDRIMTRGYQVMAEEMARENRRAKLLIFGPLVALFIIACVLSVLQHYGLIE